MNKKEIAKIASLACVQFGREITSELLDAFMLCLGSYKYKEAEDAVVVCLRNTVRHFPPTAAEIVAEIQRKKRSSSIPKSDPEPPMLSLEEIERIRKEAYRRNPQFARFMGVDIDEERE